MKTPEEIQQMCIYRKQLRGPVINAMQRFRDTYNGDVVVPLPELGETSASMVANLAQVGLDQHAMRVSSTLPNLYYPALRPGIKASEDLARTRRSANLSWHDDNRMRLILAKRARWLAGYSATPVMITPGDGIPKWNLRDPLTALPHPDNDVIDIEPQDCIFYYNRTYKWLKMTYPDKIGALSRYNPRPDDKFELLEYVDCDEHVLLVTGHDPYNYRGTTQLGSTVIELCRTPNRADICPVVAPGRITLERVMGQFDNILGMYEMQSRVTALQIIGMQRGILPPEWIVHRPGEQAQIVSEPDPITGERGQIRGGTIEQQRPDPGFIATNLNSQLERAQRITGQIPAEYGGESGSNIRTGRRGTQVLSEAVDFQIKEHQEILAASIEAENKRAIAIQKAYFGQKQFSFYSKDASKVVDYVPNKIWETDIHFVKYSNAGADINNLVISGGQRVGMGTMSKRTFMEIDPLVEDAEREHDMIVKESLEQALLSGFQNRLASGEIPEVFGARVMKLVEQDKYELADAIDKVQQEAQKLQAQQVAPTDPAAQPGLANPGAGAEAQPAIPEVAPSLKNLSQTMASLRVPQMQLAGESAA